MSMNFLVKRKGLFIAAYQILPISILCSLILCFTAGCSGTKKFEDVTPPITLETLLHEMVNRENLARLSEPHYSCRQFSSYDRDSVGLDQPGWFANWDRSQFIRIEDNEERQEYVLMDAEGPGAVVRFWATWHGAKDEEFYNGILRFYFDGSSQPAIEGRIADILSGGQLAGAPLSQSVSPKTEMPRRAHNLYFPIPYASSCKITYSSPKIENAGARSGEALYYQINYRTYDNGTPVESYGEDVLIRALPVLANTLKKLAGFERDVAKDYQQQKWSGILAPDDANHIRIQEPGAIRSLAFKINAVDIEQALRSTVLEIAFDGQQTVWTPLGDFFGTGYKLNPHKTWYTEVTDEGELKCFWVMPFARQAEVIVRNLGNQAVNIELSEVTYSGWNWDNRSLHFHSAWRNLPAVDTGKDKKMDENNTAFDVNYIEIEGQGHFVGDVLTIFNSVDAWWGEGDEKIYVDSETFPSHFGTGTEDYYGYAWCRPEFFQAPFHAQPCGDGNLTSGFSVNLRYRALDAIPFNTDFKFDMELWHWRGTRIDYAPTTMWYARPGAKANVEPAPDEARRAVTKDPETLIQAR